MRPFPVFIRRIVILLILNKQYSEPLHIQQVKECAYMEREDNNTLLFF